MSDWDRPVNPLTTKETILMLAWILGLPILFSIGYVILVVLTR